MHVCMCVRACMCVHAYVRACVCEGTSVFIVLVHDLLVFIC